MQTIKRIALDVQHMGKPDKPHDRGACYKGNIEAYLALNYAELAYQYLTQAGYETFLITCGDYTERHAWVNAHNIDLYLACHINAGGGAYSLIEYCYNAGEFTRSIASVMAGTFKEYLGTSQGKVIEIKKGGRGEACIDGVKPSALLLEPLFIETIDASFSKSSMVARAIVQAINTCQKSTQGAKP